ncbi:S-adenosylmethionine-dependent methyltransferase [Reticulomyxa filosa]|uniref:S-adenosylmethionine-dependent methyltransferase n=1 Tax=Reticulomyxa filosa TaxID=46433 RepID=X6MUF0_RETFI|nr:S-adenosylmethionine-dependent methyltransferase [Reticulomyxa filosa]|eukprot:ETO17429.1 S-adenosylmethionine-dependent methyltransferase [Reticulomyxa filosa]
MDGDDDDYDNDDGYDYEEEEEEEEDYDDVRCTQRVGYVPLKRNHTTPSKHKVIENSLWCEMCGTALDNDGEKKELECGHQFHYYCARSWPITQPCPACLQQYTF